MLDETGPWLSPSQLAGVLNVSVATVYGWRKKNNGPKGYRVGRHVRYPPAAVNKWLREQDGHGPLADAQDLVPVVDERLAVDGAVVDEIDPDDEAVS